MDQSSRFVCGALILMDPPSHALLVIISNEHFHQRSSSISKQQQARNIRGKRSRVLCSLQSLRVDCGRAALPRTDQDEDDGHSQTGLISRSASAMDSGGGGGAAPAGLLFAHSPSSRTTASSSHLMVEVEEVINFSSHHKLSHVGKGGGCRGLMIRGGI